MTQTVIHRVTELDLTFRPKAWAFSDKARGDIDAHFTKARAEKPALWNGPLLLGSQPRFSADRFSAEYREIDFASFLAWRDWGFPDTSVFNGFGVGALRASDGAFVMGEMGEHTANAGKIYFPSGTPDPNDLRGEVVDIAGSVVREVAEETGLQPSDYVAADHWHCIVARGIVAMMRVLSSDLSGGALRARIVGNLAGQQRPEFSAVHLVRSMADVTPAMPGFVAAFLDQAFRETT